MYRHSPKDKVAVILKEFLGFSAIVFSMEIDFMDLLI